MATILLVEDEPDLGLFEAGLLEAEGHQVFRCSGGPTFHAACPMLQGRRCALVDAADLILFSCGMFAPIQGRRYNGTHLLRAYRAHPDYGRLPMLVVNVGIPKQVSGSGKIESIARYSSPRAVVEAVDRLLAV